jgi:hypothetical protein
MMRCPAAASVDWTVCLGTGVIVGLAGTGAVERSDRGVSVGSAFALLAKGTAVNVGAGVGCMNP